MQHCLNWFFKFFRILLLLLRHIHFHISWILIFPLVICSFNYAILKSFPETDQVLSLLWSFCGAIFFLLSILLHEFSHNACLLILKKYNRKKIIFIFGSVQPNDLFSEPSKHQAITAISGPLFNSILVICWYAIYIWADSAEIFPTLILILKYQVFINVIIAAINLLPLYPLDIGISLRYILSKRFSLSTNRVIVNLGNLISIITILGGIILISTGFFITGVWCIVVGFSYKAALNLANQKELLLRSLYGESVSNYMRRDPITVYPSLTLDQFMINYNNRFHETIYPVLQYSSVQGIVNLQKVREIPQDQWKHYTIAELMNPISSSNTVTTDTDMTLVLKLLIKHPQQGLLVVKKESLHGTITNNEVIHFLAPMLCLPIKTKGRKNKESKRSDSKKLPERCYTKVKNHSYESIYNRL